MDSKRDPRTVDEYMSSLPEDVHAIMEEIRRTIRSAAPEAEETISYQMPAFKLRGRYLLGVAAWKKHIAFYPIPSGDEAFEKELSRYVAGKGTLRFPLDEPIPYGLVKQIVEARVEQL